MNNTKYSKNRQIGNIGENIAVTFLEKHKYRIIERNYFRKWGEIDIIAAKDEVIHFIEVKSVSKSLVRGPYSKDVIHETDQYAPEDNAHPGKLRKMRRVVESYMAEHKISPLQYWQCDLVTVLIDKKLRLGRVSLIKDIII